MTRPVARWLARWTGTVACLVLAGVWLGSAVCGVQVQSHLGNGVSFFSGWCQITWGYDVATFRMMRKFGFEEVGGVEVFRPRFAHIEWSWHPIYLSTFSVTIPGWYPVAAIGFPTALLWWLDRPRTPAGHCRNCGYNLTGNVSGRCPECGSSAQRA